MHSVKDSPDPTRHNYVTIKFYSQDTTLGLIQDIDVHQPLIHDVEDKRLSTQSCFKPNTHTMVHATSMLHATCHQ